MIISLEPARYHLRPRSGLTAVTRTRARVPEVTPGLWLVNPTQVSDQRSSHRVLVAVIADTHLPRGARRLPGECLERLRSGERIVHLGDLVPVPFVATATRVDITRVPAQPIPVFVRRSVRIGAASGLPGDAGSVSRQASRSWRFATLDQFFCLLLIAVLLLLLVLALLGVFAAIVTTVVVTAVAVRRAVAVLLVPSRRVAGR